MKGSVGVVKCQIIDIKFESLVQYDSDFWVQIVLLMINK